ncbi:uncharacterized protein LOC109808359 isoform X2 [Cajanus cajan]|uniref:uncharacterized protein LOC109808359 isoform X2 n=1 Tax=Cajanus cajan TaxID=3821 RepID=UPI00098DBAF2|nr:uncharacterized protein LOC109808359 isoform X2 [Cajanus cajan]
MPQQDITDTTSLSYWLNWRFYLCAVIVLLSMVLAFLVIWKHKGSRLFRSVKGENQQDGTLSGDEAWKPCLKEIHPVCLLAFRVIAFSSLLATLIAKIHINSGSIFFYYTQWTFTLVTIYFGCASVLSMYGCYQHKKSSTVINVNIARMDAEHGPYMPLLHQDSTNLSRMEDLADPHAEIHKNQVAPIWSYIFQILFQMNAGAVMLTDSVYWFIIFPFLTLRDYDFNFSFQLGARDDSELAYSKCCFAPWRCSSKLSENTLVWDIFLCVMDKFICHFSVGYSCFHLDLVAIPIP